MAPRYSIIPGDAVYDTSLTDFELRVLTVLGRHSDSSGWCYINQGKMADKLGKNRSSVNRAVKKLCTKGYVQKEDRRSIMHGEHQQNICFYRVMMDRHGPPEALPVGVDEVHDPIHAEMGVRLSKLAERGLKQRDSAPLCSQDHNTLCSQDHNTTTPSLTTGKEKESMSSTPFSPEGKNGAVDEDYLLFEKALQASVSRDPRTGAVWEVTGRKRDTSIFTGDDVQDRWLENTYDTAFGFAEEIDFGISDARLRKMIREAASSRVGKQILTDEGLASAKVIIARILENQGYVELEVGGADPESVRDAIRILLDTIQRRFGRRKGEWLNHWSVISLRFAGDESWEEWETDKPIYQDESVPF